MGEKILKDKGPPEDGGGGAQVHQEGDGVQVNPNGGGTS